MEFWSGRKVLVTGGASFIGSFLVEQLVTQGAEVRVADDLSSGKEENLKACVSDVDFRLGDLKNPGFATESCEGREVVFHLAADHGGRGYVDLHKTACAMNMALDHTVFSSCLQTGVGKIVFASSGCVYPNYLQTDVNQETFLTEDSAGPPYDPDGTYGMAKLAGELTLRAMHEEHGIGASSCRYFTVYGPRGVENHAVMAMIARAFVGEDPFAVWGTGEQVRNWTFVSDIVSGTMLAAEHINDGTAVNLGTMERIRVIEAAQLVLEYTGHRANLQTRPDMPTGPMNRVADNSLAGRLLGWEPEVLFKEGLKRTVDWYFSTKNRSQVRSYLSEVLTERPNTPPAEILR